MRCTPSRAPSVWINEVGVCGPAAPAAHRLQVYDEDAGVLVVHQRGVLPRAGRVRKYNVGARWSTPKHGGDLQQNRRGRGPQLDGRPCRLLWRMPTWPSTGSVSVSLPKASNTCSAVATISAPACLMQRATGFEQPQSRAHVQRRSPARLTGPLWRLKDHVLFHMGRVRCNTARTVQVAHLKRCQPMQATIGRQMCSSATCFACTRGGRNRVASLLLWAGHKLCRHATCTCPCSCPPFLKQI